MSLEKSVFRFVEAVKEAEDIPALEALLEKHLEPIGVDFYMCGQFVMPGGITKTTRLFGLFDSDWFQYYEQNYLFLDDPCVRLLRSSYRPYSWSWIVDAMDLTEGEKRVMEEASRFGFSDGVVLPMRGPGGALAGAALAGRKFKADGIKLIALRLIVEEAYYRAITLTGLFEEKAPSLISKRQRECLNWAQYGKSNREIAGILGISPHTVKEHIDTAKRAFGVNTRVEAVVFARNANLIGFSPLSSNVRPVPSASER